MHRFLVMPGLGLVTKPDRRCVLAMSGCYAHATPLTRSARHRADEVQEAVVDNERARRAFANMLNANMSFPA